MIQNNPILEFVINNDIGSLRNWVATNTLSRSKFDKIINQSLVEAAKVSKPEIVGYLIELGAVVYYNNNAPLTFAIMRRDSYSYDVVDLLIHYDALLFDKINYAIHLAGINNKTNLTQLFLKKYSENNSKSNNELIHPLACSTISFETLKIINSFGIEIFYDFSFFGYGQKFTLPFIKEMINGGFDPKKLLSSDETYINHNLYNLRNYGELLFFNLVKNLYYKEMKYLVTKKLEFGLTNNFLANCVEKNLDQCFNEKKYFFFETQIEREKIIRNSLLNYTFFINHLKKYSPKSFTASVQNSFKKNFLIYSKYLNDSTKNKVLKCIPINYKKKLKMN